MNNQEAFNNAWEYHVVKGKPLGYNYTTGECSYRDGCAIGCQVPPELMSELAEGHGIVPLLNEIEAVHSFFEGCDGNFLSDLQDAHDRAVDDEMCKELNVYNRSLYDIKEYYSRVAKSWGLNIPDPTQT